MSIIEMTGLVCEQTQNLKWKKGQNKLRKILKLIPIPKYDYKPKLTSQFQSCPVCQGHGFDGSCYNCYGKGWLD